MKPEKVYAVLLKPDQHRRLKIQAARRGLKMIEVVDQAAEMWLSNPGEMPSLANGKGK